MELSNRFKSSSDKIKAYYTLERLYFAKNDFIEGDKYQKKILQMRDSLYIAENSKALAEFDVKYKTAEKEKQLTESKLETAQTRNWTIGLEIAFFIIRWLWIFILENPKSSFTSNRNRKYPKNTASP